MKYFLTLLAGLILGGVLTYFLVFALPQMGQPKDAPAQGPPPPTDSQKAATATVTLDEQFFEALLGTIFREIGTPKFNAGGSEGGACQAQVEIVELGPEGARTNVRLQNGAIVAPLAFNGAVEVLPGAPCLNFRGTAEADITLRFEPGEQTLYGYLNVRTVKLDNLGEEYTPLATSAVQTAVNQKINPITIMRSQQLQFDLPVRASNGSLNARALDVRSEIQGGAMKLFVTYEFKGSQGLAPEPSPASQ